MHLCVQEKPSARPDSLVREGVLRVQRLCAKRGELVSEHVSNPMCWSGYGAASSNRGVAYDLVGNHVVSIASRVLGVGSSRTDSRLTQGQHYQLQEDPDQERAPE